MFLINQFYSSLAQLIETFKTFCLGRLNIRIIDIRPNNEMANGTGLMRFLGNHSGYLCLEVRGGFMLGALVILMSGAHP